MLRRARIYDSHTRQWALITPAQEWDDGEVCHTFNPVVAECLIRAFDGNVCCPTTLFDITLPDKHALGTHNRINVSWLLLRYLQDAGCISSASFATTTCCIKS